MPKFMHILGPWKLTGIAMVLCILAFAGFLSYQYWLFKGGIFSTANFNRSEWLSSSNHSKEGDCYRGGMFDDIENTVIKINMTRSQVVDTLGVPDEISKSSVGYSLGMCSGLRIDYDSLYVNFDTNGRVIKVARAQH